jgi:secretin/TonB-like protein
VHLVCVDLPVRGYRQWLTHAFRFLSAIVIAVTAISATSDLYAEGVSARSEAPIDYEITAQELDAAIRAYIRASGAQVFFETSLTAGRRSTEIKGRFTAGEALEMLLTGTGLTASRTDVDAFIIAPIPERDAVSSMSTARPDSRFLTALQTTILDALCREAQTRPGGYKAVIELWIAPEGVVRQSALIGSTGDTQRDRVLLRNLLGVPISAKPPPGMRQPVVMTIGQRAPHETGDCAG